MIFTQWNKILSSKDGALRELLTVKANATYEWMADLDSFQHLWTHLRLTFSCQSLHVWTDRCGNSWSASPELLWTAFVTGALQQIQLNAFNVGDFHASFRLHGNIQPQRICTYILTVIIMSFLERNIAQVHKMWLDPKGCALHQHRQCLCAIRLCRYVCTFADFFVCLSYTLRFLRWDQTSDKYLL